MATKNEEYIAVSIVLISLIILSIFFGVFWSFLLVFTFLLLAYFSGRPQTKKKITTKKFKIKPESLDNSLDESEYLSNGGKDVDVPFTGLPSPKFPTQTLRSPMPLLSSLTVTKRLSFNVSSLTSPDGQIYMLGNTSRRLSTTLGSPRQSPMSPISSPQTKYFSLINPSLQQPSTVKIATPEIYDRTMTIDEPKKPTDSSLSRAAILSALKQSTIRKRSVVEDEDDGDDISSSVENHKKKRRYHYPSSKTPTTTDTTDLEITRDIIPEPPSVTRKNTGIYSLVQTRLKRRPLHNDGHNTTEEAVVTLKKTRQDYDDKTTGPSEATETTDPECEDSRAVQMTASVVHTERITSKTSYDDDNDSGCDADDDDDIVMKTVPSTTATQRLSKKQAQKLAEKRKRMVMKASSTPSHTPERSSSRHTSTLCNTPDVTVSRQQRLSKKQGMLNTPTASEITTTSTNDSPASEKSDVSGQDMSPRKRFTVVRFPSRKNEAKRRPVPVYCASVNSPDLPKRRSVTHKITKEDIELDRKMAWQRVQSLLDGSEDEEEKEKSQGASPSVAIHVTTRMPSPSRSQTVTVTTTSGIPSTSTLVSGKSSGSQDTAVRTSQSTSAPSTGTMQPSTLLSGLAPSKPSETAPLTSVSAQSTISLLSTGDLKTSIFSQGTLTASGTPLPPGQASVNSTNLSSTTQGFSLTAKTSNATVELSSATSTPGKIVLGAPTSDPANTATLASFTTSSQSIQTPICTPIAQTLLGTKPTITTPALPATTSSALNLGSAIGKPPQIGSNTSKNVPQTGFNLPQPGSSVSSNLTGFSAPSNLLQSGSSTSSGLTSFSAATAPQTELKSNLLKTGLDTSSILLQPGVSTTSSLPKFNFGATGTAGQKPASMTPAATKSMFSGLNANTAGSTLSSAAKVTTQPSQSGFAPPGGFSFSASTAPKTTSQGSTFTFGANQQTVAPKTTTQTSTFSFGTNQQPAAPSPFGSQPGTSSSASTAPKTTTQTTTFMFGGSQQPTAPSSFGAQQSTTKGFNSTTSSNLFGAQPSTTSSTPAFGFPSSSSQSTFGNTGTSATPGGFKFGTNTATPSGFGNTTQQAATNSTPSGQFSFSAGASGTTNQSQNKPGFSFAAGANSTSTSQPFGAPSSQNTFGAGANTNAFGASTTQTPFGASTNPSAFASPATTQANQNAFGSTTQSAFGSPAPQNVFGNPPGSSSTGGFGFGGGSNTSTPSGGGFKFGATASSGFPSTPNAAPTFGAAPSATPASSAVGFNFGAGSMSGTPAFGASTPSAGGFSFGAGAQSTSSSVAKPRPKATARRRTRK